MTFTLFQNFLVAFFIALFSYQQNYITKALPILFLCYLSFNNDKLIAIGLLFSSFGDIALAFDKSQPLYFLIGLGMFLIAHIFYSISFFQSQKRISLFSSKTIITIIIALLYYVIMMKTLIPHIKSQLTTT